jgi:hypothetical protein
MAPEFPTWREIFTVGQVVRRLGSGFRIVQINVGQTAIPRFLIDLSPVRERCQ